MEIIQIKKALKNYKILKVEDSMDYTYIIIEVKEGLISFDLPKEFDNLVYSFEVYGNGQICLYINKELNK